MHIDNDGRNTTRLLGIQSSLLHPNKFSTTRKRKILVSFCWHRSNPPDFSYSLHTVTLTLTIFVHHPHADTRKRTNVPFGFGMLKEAVVLFELVRVLVLVLGLVVVVRAVVNDG
jgi:hypothetical protein